MKQLIAYAIIKSGTGDCEEDFEVSSRDNAEKEIRAVVQYFNDTLKHGETPREFISIERFEEKEKQPSLYSDSDFDIDEDADDPVWDDYDPDPYDDEDDRW